VLAVCTSIDMIQSANTPSFSSKDGDTDEEGLEE